MRMLHGRWLLITCVALVVLVDISPIQAQSDAAGDPLPVRALGRFGTSRFRHGSRIECLAMASDGRRIAAAGTNDPIRVWDAESGKQLFSFPEPWINALVFTKYGGQLLSGGALKTIRIWNLASGKEDAQLTGHAAAITALAISADNILIASADESGVIFLWETGLGRVTTKIAEFKGHTDAITSLAFSPDADSIYLVSGSADRTVRVWSTVKKTMLHQLDAGGAVASVVFTDDTTIAAAGDGKSIRLWNVADGKAQPPLTGHEGNIVSLAAGRDRGNSTLVSSGEDEALRVWHVGTRKELLNLRRAAGDAAALAVSKDGGLIACGGSGNTIRIFDGRSGKERVPAAGSQSGLAQLALAPDGKTLATVADDGTITIWDRAARQPLRSWQSRHAAEIVLAYSPDGTLLATCGRGDPVRFWDPQTGKENFQFPAKPGDQVLALRFAHQGTMLAVGYRSGLADVWDWKQKNVVQQPKLAAPGGVQAVAFSLDAKRLALGGQGRILLWDMVEAKEIRVQNSKESEDKVLPAVAALAFASDGKTLAVGCYDGVIRLVNHQTGKEIRALEGHLSVPYALAFSGDGRILASGSFDKTLRLWETFSGLTIASLQGHQGPVFGIGITPDGRTAFSASGDTSALAWDVTGQVGFGNLPNPDTAWRDLASENVAEAHRALWGYIAQGDAGLQAVAKQLYLIDPKQIDQLFKDLTNKNFTVRLKASKELERYGRWMEGRYREALARKPELEEQRRIELLLSNLTGGLTLEQERMRVRRVMLILEQFNTPAARQVLQSLIDGAPEVELQAEARVSLERLAGKR